MPDKPISRWSDERLERFHEEFVEHISLVAEGRDRQEELYEAIFRKEDKDANVPPGLMQLTVRIADELRTMRIYQDRQKTFIGGAVFVLSCLGFFLTDSAHRLVGIVKNL